MKLADLDWVVGHWVGEIDGDSIAECYEPEVAGQMLGWMRWWNADSVKLYEFIVVGEFDGQIEMRIRHLRGSLATVEDEPICFLLESVGSNSALWRQIESGDNTTLAWHRQGDDLTITLTVNERPTTFRYHRA